MKYEVHFGQRAAEAYDSLPLSILDQFDAHIDLLAENPPAVAVPGSFPFPPNRMVYHFSIEDIDGTTWYFAAHFRYQTDEIHLTVFAVTVQHSD